MPRGKSRKDAVHGYLWGAFDHGLFEDESILEEGKTDHQVLNQFLGLEGQDQLLPGKAITPLERAAISEEIDAIKRLMRDYKPGEYMGDLRQAVRWKFLEAAEQFERSAPNFQLSAVNTTPEVQMNAVPYAPQLQEDPPETLYVSDPDLDEMDHYRYLNLLLGLEGDEKLGPDEDFDAEAIKRRLLVIKQHIDDDVINPDLMMKTQNIQKIRQLVDDLFDPLKKLDYDDAQRALTNGSVELHRPLREPIYLKPVQSIKNIIAEFGQFKNDWLREKPQHKEEEFSYSKSSSTPVVHTFTFPDEASCIAFLDRITNEKLAVRQDHPVPSDVTLEQPQSDSDRDEEPRRGSRFYDL